MVLITDPGIYQVSAMLSNDVRLRIKKNSDLYAHTFGGWVNIAELLLSVIIGPLISLS